MSKLGKILLLVLGLVGLAGGYLLGVFLWSYFELPPMDQRYWFYLLFLIGYGICSAANVAYFSFGKRDLTIMVRSGETAEKGSSEAQAAKEAAAILKHLKNPNFTLAAILLTNVFFGVQLSQLSPDLFVGLYAVMVPLLSISLFGEFFAQATGLRFANKFCYWASPIVTLLKWVTGILSYPLGLLVTALVGEQGIKRLVQDHMEANLKLEVSLAEASADRDPTLISKREALSMVNVIQADDELAINVGERLDPNTVIPMKFSGNKPIFSGSPRNFVAKHLCKSQQPWFLLIDEDSNEPQMAFDADGFARNLLSSEVLDESIDPAAHTYRVKIYKDQNVQVGTVWADFQVREEHPKDDEIDVDVAFIICEKGWYIITGGGDMFGRFSRGVTRRRDWSVQILDTLEPHTKFAVTQSEQEQINLATGTKKVFKKST